MITYSYLIAAYLPTYHHIGYNIDSQALNWWFHTKTKHFRYENKYLNQNKAVYGHWNTPICLQEFSNSKVSHFSALFVCLFVCLGGEVG